MKVRSLKKLYFKKATIVKINKTASQYIKGGTRSFEPNHEPNTGLESHCADVVCY